MSVSASTRHRIGRLWHRGFRICEIGQATGLPSGSVRNELKKLNVDRSAPRNHVPKVVKIRRLLDLASDSTIAEVLGTTANYVRKVRSESK